MRELVFSTLFMGMNTATHGAPPWQIHYGLMATFLALPCLTFPEIRQTEEYIEIFSHLIPAEFNKSKFL